MVVLTQGEQGLNRVAILAKVDWMWAGLAKLGESEQHAVLNLVYPQPGRNFVLQVAQEMQRRGQEPWAAMLSRPRYVDLAVVFHLRHVGFEFVSKIAVPETLRPAGSALLADQMEVAATAIAEFKYPDLAVFLDTFHRHGKFQLSLTDETQKSSEEQFDPLWVAELSLLHPDLPQGLEIEIR